MFANDEGVLKAKGCGHCLVGANNLLCPVTHKKSIFHKI